jgi:hypothetical protein
LADLRKKLFPFQISTLAFNKPASAKNYQRDQNYRTADNGDKLPMNYPRLRGELVVKVGHNKIKNENL